MQANVRLSLMITKWYKTTKSSFSVLFLADHATAVRFVGDFLKKNYFYLLFSCRLVKARLTLRLLGLKFGGFWEAAALLMLQLSFVFGFTAEVVMPAMLATISIATPFPILRHVVKWQNTRDFSWRIKLALEPEEESASSCLSLVPMPHQRGVLERDFPFGKCVSLSLLCCSVACSLWQKNRCRCKFVS